MSGPRVRIAVSSAGVAVAEGGRECIGVPGMGASDTGGSREYPLVLRRDMAAGGGATVRGGRVGLEVCRACVWG